MKNLWLKTGAVASAALWSMAAMAQSPSSTTATVPANPSLSGKSSADAQVVAPAAKPLPIGISDFSTLYGPPVNDLGKHSSADSEIDALQGEFIRNDIGFSYKLSKNLTIQPTLEFDLMLADAGSKASNEGFHWRDCYVKAAYSGLMETNLGSNKLALDGDIRFYVPTSKTARDTNRIGAVRMDVMPSLTLGKSKWSVSAVGYAKYFLQSKDGNESVDPASVKVINGVAQYTPLDRLILYAGPQLNYEFSDKVTAFMLYEVAGVWNTHGMPDYLNYNTSNTDLEPGVSLTLHDRLTVIPALNWYTNQRLSTTSLLLSASLKLL